MKTFKLKDMVRGWFAGDFEPTAFKTDACEAGFRFYKAGDKEEKHVHKIATELTLVTSGIVIMNGVELKEGDIMVLGPGEPATFEAVTDATNVVIKVPGAKHDKYLL